MAKQAEVKPTYLKGNRPYKVALHDVVRMMKMIDDHKHTKKFQEAAKSKKAFVSVHPETVNFVKDYLVKNNMHAHPMGKQIVNAQAVSAQGVSARAANAQQDVCVDFKCEFGS